VPVHGWSAVKRIGSKLRWATPGLVVLGWGVSIASLALTAITQGILVPHAFEYVLESNIGALEVALYYAGIFGTSFLAGLVLARVAAALLAFFVSYVVGWLLAYLALSLPGLLGIVPEGVAEETAIILTATALFPFALLVGMLGSLIGSAYRES